MLPTEQVLWPWLRLLEEDTEWGCDGAGACNLSPVLGQSPDLLPTLNPGHMKLLFFFSSPAWSLLYSFLFQANEPAVQETRIPLYNLRQARPGCSFSIKPSFSRLSFPGPGRPRCRRCACSAVQGRTGACGAVHRLSAGCIGARD